MPSLRIQLILNTNQSIKTVAIVNQDDDLLSNLATIAKNKLKVTASKALFYSKQGQPLSSATELVNLALDPVQNEATVIVSAGEPFVGNVVESTRPAEAPATVRILADKSFVDQEAVAQLKTTSTLPGMRLAVGMPDLHQGLKFPIGAVFMTQDILYPSLIGNDIGCGMSFYRLKNIKSNNVDASKLASQLSSIDCKWDGNIQQFLEPVQTSPFDESLGTVGGGNHFAEFQQVDQVVDEALFSSLGLSAEETYLLGKGLGEHILNQVTMQHGTKGLDISSNEAQSYLEQHQHAIQWAQKNRELIAHRLLTFIHQDIYDSNCVEKVIDITHNYVTQKTVDSGQVLWLHRKGAAPSDQGFAIIPGSRGSFSYLVLPQGDQEKNGYSLAHGAGRKLTRTKCLTKIREKYGKGDRAVQALKSTRFGSQVICEDKSLLFEEAPDAYKPIEEIVQDLKEFCTVVAILKPIVTYKKK